MISSRNKLVQVKISKVAYEYIKRYCEVFGGTMSQYCAIAIQNQILLGVKRNETQTKKNTS